MSRMASSFWVFLISFLLSIITTETAIKNHEELWPEYAPMETAPELMEFFGNWAFDEVTGSGNIGKSLMLIY